LTAPACGTRGTHDNLMRRVLCGHMGAYSTSTPCARVRFGWQRGAGRTARTPHLLLPADGSCVSCCGRCAPRPSTVCASWLLQHACSGGFSSCVGAPAPQLGTFS
jgi:hypothetical protein